MAKNKIKRAKERKRYISIDSLSIQDIRLSWKATGLLAYMLTMPDDWEFYVSELKNHKTDGRDSTANGLKELEKAGYLVKEKKRDENGKFTGYDYILYEQPVNGKPVNGKPVNGKPVNGKPVTTKDLLILNTNNTKKGENIKKAPSFEDSAFNVIFEGQEEKEKNSAKKEKESGIPSPSYPKKFSKSMVTACEAYFAHRVAIGKPFSNVKAKETKVMSFQAEVAQYGENIVISSIYECISNGWVKNFPKVGDKKTKKNGKGKKDVSLQEALNWFNDESSQED